MASPLGIIAVEKAMVNPLALRKVLLVCSQEVNPGDPLS